MILRPILAQTNVWSAPVDPSATFESGMIAGLIEINGELFVTVSDGDTIPPVGVLDDSKTTAFTGTVIDELIVVPTAVQEVNGVLVSTVDVLGLLAETNLIESTFTSNLDITLNPKKGAVIVPAGTPINYESNGNYGFEIITSYRFTIVDFPGNDTTDGSGQVAIHFNRGLFSTNVFDTLSVYAPGSPLFVDAEGKLTSQDTGGPVVAISMQPASAINEELLFMWL